MLLHPALEQVFYKLPEIISVYEKKMCKLLLPILYALHWFAQVDFDGAIADYSAAIGLDPGLTVAYYNRGLVHYRLGEHSAAAADLEVAVSRCPDNIDYVEALEACLKVQTAT